MSKEIFKTVNVLGLNVFSDSMEKIPMPEKCVLISTINPIAYGTSTSDELFRQSLKHSEYLMLDGVYFALSSFILLGKNIRRNQGPDIYKFFMNKANQDGSKVFFLGASESTLQKMKDRAALEYPNIIIDYFSPPFKHEFSNDDNNIMVDKINSFQPEYLFIGMTAPKQEKWAYLQKDRLNVKFAISVGAVFDWYAGTQKTIAPIWWKLRLAWLVRTIQRPEILKRYPKIFIFCKHVFFARLGIKKYKE